MHVTRALYLVAILPALAVGISRCGGDKGPTSPTGPTKLVFLGQPSAAAGSQPITPGVQVAVQDALGNTVTAATNAVTITLDTSQSVGALSGTLTVPAIEGVATFSDLRIDLPGSGYRLKASAAGLVGATSAPFAVTLTFASVSAGNIHTCGVTTDDAAYCWGGNIGGALGNGTTTQQTTPVAVLGGLAFAAVSAGYNHACGVTAGGSAYCWGLNYAGQLGNGATTQPASPVLVVGQLTVAAVSSGGEHSCALTTAGTTYCWGRNSSGQLGDGTLSDRTSPVAVVGGLTFAMVSAGGAHTCGVTTRGAAYCWGRNDEGQVGDSDRIPIPANPEPVLGGLSFASVSTGTFYTCGVTIGGAAYCWGANGNGQLGDGTTTNQSTPVAVTGGLTFTTVSGGYDHTCGVTTAGAAYCWGANGYGQLGDGTATNQSSPVAVVGGLTFAAVSAGYGHTCGVTTGGATYCWGLNNSGQVGDGTTTDRPSPVRVVQ